MTRTRIISTVAATFIAAATAAPALAGGEAKNEGPFTRPVTVQQASAGEPKNELPFTKLSIALMPSCVTFVALPRSP